MCIRDSTRAKLCLAPLVFRIEPSVRFIYQKNLHFCNTKCRFFHIFKDIKAVSYTHLDVYKRQIKYQIIVHRKEPKSSAVPWFFLIKPVSIRHGVQLSNRNRLYEEEPWQDVYKRQLYEHMVIVLLFSSNVSFSN